MFHVEQKPSEEIPRDGSLEKLEFFERAGPFGLEFQFPGQGSSNPGVRHPRPLPSCATGACPTLFLRVQLLGRLSRGCVARRLWCGTLAGEAFGCKMFHVEQNPSEEIPNEGSLERLPYLHETGSSHRTIVPRGTVRCLVRRPRLNVRRETVLPGTKRVQRALRKRGKSEAGI